MNKVKLNELIYNMLKKSMNSTNTIQTPRIKMRSDHKSMTLNTGLKHFFQPLPEVVEMH